MTCTIMFIEQGSVHKQKRSIITSIPIIPLFVGPLFRSQNKFLFRVMTSIVFNSVPREDIEETWGNMPDRQRAKTLIREMKR